MKKLKKESGFSLVELALVLAIVGLAVATALETYNTYARTKVIGTAIERKMNVEAALARYVSANGAFPCPADPALPSNNPNAGVSNCMAGSTSVPDASGGVLRVAGMRDTNADLDSVVDPVLVGMVPYTTLGISARESIDSWGSRLTYAISQYLTNPATYNPQRGAIRVELYDQSAGTDNPILNGSVPSQVVPGAGTPDAFMLALVSHGPDRKGAYNIYGARPIACNSTQGRDNENCDGDAAFREVTYQVSSRDSAQFYDDPFLTSDISLDSDKWKSSGAMAMGNKQEGAGNVGIGTWNPQEKVDVNGAVLADEVHAQRFCNAAGANCFPAELVAGAGSTCTGGLMAGIQNAAADCAAKVSTAGITPGSCGTGQYMVGFNANGTIKCQ
jgi:prepilin-type N-terminal cleavage/methylation domain-containing protein